MGNIAPVRVKREVTTKFDRRSHGGSQNDGFCHFDCDGFCRLTSEFEVLANSFAPFQNSWNFIFQPANDFQNSNIARAVCPGFRDAALVPRRPGSQHL